MSIKRRLGRPKPRDSHTAPEPEGPGEVYRKFERLNGRGVSGRSGRLRELAGGTEKKALYGVFAVVEIAAIVLGLFLDVPFMDIVALGLPGLLIMFHRGSREEAEEETQEKTEEESLPDRLRRLLGE